MTHAGFVSVCALLGAVGCSDRDAVRDLGDSARSMVRVDVSYTRVAGANGVSEPRFDAQAHFVRYRSFDPASVPTLLGFPDFDNIPLDSCRVTDGTADLDEALATPGEVSLLDAGRVDVRGPIDRAQMRRSHYPELVPFVSGIIYGADEARPLSLGLGQPYQVSGEGGEEVGPFSSTVSAPRGFPMLVLLPLRRSDSMDVRWAANFGIERAEEPLLLEVKWSSRAGSRAVRCRVRDDGEFTIGREAFESLPAQPAQATVTATRVARSAVVAPGAGKGELTFELRDVAPLQVIP
jgi:hypothetical protein